MPHDESNKDFAHIQSFVDECSDEELEYLKHCVNTRMEDMESDSSEKLDKEKVIDVSKSKVKKEKIYSLDSLDKEF